MLASISASSFSSPNFLVFNPIVSTILTWVSFWYSKLTSFHFLFNPSLRVLTSYSDRHCLNINENILLLIVLLMQVLDHLVLVLNVLLDLFDVLGHLAIVLLFQVFHGLGGFLCGGEDVFNSVGHYEVFVALEAVDRALFGTGHGVFFVAALV
jgi:hypothetical protein